MAREKRRTKTSVGMETGEGGTKIRDRRRRAEAGDCRPQEENDFSRKLILKMHQRAGSESMFVSLPAGKVLDLKKAKAARGAVTNA